MSEFWNHMIGVSGLFIGVLSSLIAYLIARRHMKKKRHLDERQRTISVHARAGAWVVTSVLIVLVWAADIMVEGITFSFFALTFLYVGHWIAFLVTGIYHTNQN